VYLFGGGIRLHGVRRRSPKVETKLDEHQPEAAPIGGRNTHRRTTMEDSRALNRRYSLVGWGALLVWIGAVSFLPGERLPFGLGLMGIGIIILGVNGARHVIHALPVKGIDITLGTLALAWGAAELFRSSAFIPIALIAIGLVLLIGGGLERKVETTAPGCC
jgi:hypothetical protein